jgi:hypothetical protein
MHRAILLVVFAAVAAAQSPKYPWQHSGTQCNETMTFCWYAAEEASDAQATAYGNHWVAQDKDEKPIEWITEVRCLKDSKLCILARNQKVMNGSQTTIDLYRIEEWTKVQIRAIGENELPTGKECEIDTLILNRVEGSVSMLSAPGPAAATKPCMGFTGTKPKTVIYKLEIAPPKF